MPQSTSSHSHSHANTPRNTRSRVPSASSAQSSSSHLPLSLPPTPAHSPGSPTPKIIDMKSLLAKPAPPYARHAHTHGGGSDSEGMCDGARGKPALFHRPSQSSKETTAPGVLGRSKSAQSLSSPAKGKEIDASHLSESERAKRPRNVLRRRPSTQKSVPALPTTTPAIVSSTSTNAGNTTSIPAAIYSPLPPLPPHSPLIPSILPLASPKGSSSSLRPSTAPSPSPKSNSLGAPLSRSVSSLDKPLPLPPPQEPPDDEKRPSGYGGAQPRRVRSREWRDRREEEMDPDECLVSVTDERGQRVDTKVRSRLRELKGHPFPSSPSPSPSHSPLPSRPSSPSIRLHHHPRNLTAASAPTSRAPSKSRSRSTSRNPPPTSDPDTNNTITITNTTKSSTSLSPAAAVVAAYKRQAFLQDRPASGRASSVDTSASMSGFSRMSFGGGGEGFAAIQRIASFEAGSKTKERSPSSRRRHHSSSGHVRAVTEPHKKGEENEDEEGRQPYYTVFGSTSGRVVAVGGPEDYRHLSWGITPPSRLVRKESAGGGLRTLTRKVSGRFKRNGGGGTQSEGEDKEGERRGVSLNVERGRQSLQEKSGAGGKHAKRASISVLGKGRSLRLSIDQFPVEVKVSRVGKEKEKEKEKDSVNEKEKERKEKETPPTSATKSPISSASTPSPRSGGGSRIWKLMKRISTGGLREKYNEEPPPPVPSLPKEYASPSRIRSAEAEKARSPTPPLSSGFGKVVRKKASLVLGARVSSGGSSPTKSPLPRSPLATHASIPHCRAPRQSTTTRSSSPISSDVASARFFSGPGYKHSAHSSASSLLDDSVPPLPNSHLTKTSSVGQYIIPPSELGKLQLQFDEHGGSEESFASSHPRSTQRSISPTPSQGHLMKLKVVVPSSPQKAPRTSDEYVIVHTPALPITSLPLPPRRAGRLGRMRRGTNTPTTGEEVWVGMQEQREVEPETGVRGEEMQEWERMWGGSGNEMPIARSRSGSPIIPSFSTVDPINTFVSKRASGSKSSPSWTLSTSPTQIHQHPSQLDDMGYSPAESLPPPPRKIIRPASTSTPTSPVQASLSPRSPSSFTSISPPATLGRRSTGGHSITSTLTMTNARHRRRSSSFISSTSIGSPSSPPISSSASPPRRAMTFRELGRANAGLLTEQEKSARWDDLLERSAQAGGTLHLDIGRSGEDGLKSDGLRFSDFSELNT